MHEARAAATALLCFVPALLPREYLLRAQPARSSRARERALGSRARAVPALTARPLKRLHVGPDQRRRSNRHCWRALWHQWAHLRTRLRVPNGPFGIRSIRLCTV